MVDFAAGRYAMNEAAITEAMILTKAADWQYEHEWRLTSGSGRDPGQAFEDAKFNPQELTGFVLGARMPAIARLHFAELARAINPNVEVLQAQLAPRAFKIELLSA